MIVYEKRCHMVVSLSIFAVSYEVQKLDASITKYRNKKKMFLL